MTPSGGEGVSEHFEQRAAWWDRIYGEKSLEGRILLRRQQVALSWIDALVLGSGSSILEVGCGAGATSVELGKRGHRVSALDRSQAMIDRTREHVAASGVGELVSPLVGDVHRLMFTAATFDLVVAIGVLSWLQRPDAAIDEMARVVRPGGHVLLTALNSLDIAYLLDPGRNPALGPAKRVLQPVASLLGRPRLDRPRPKRYSRWSIRRGLRGSGLIPVRQATVGFGPFTFLGKPLLSADRSLRTDEALQRRADSNRMLLRSAGRLYLVLAHKPTSPAPRSRVSAPSSGLRLPPAGCHRGEWVGRFGARRDEEWAPPSDSDDGGRRSSPDRGQLDLPHRSLASVRALPWPISLGGPAVRATSSVTSR